MNSVRGVYEKNKRTRNYKEAQKPVATELWRISCLYKHKLSL